MAYNLLSCERDQSYLMPPSMRDWLSEGHLAWFIVDAVGQMDLREFYAVYRSDGWGAAAYDPGMMVAIPVVRLLRGCTQFQAHSPCSGGRCRIPGGGSQPAARLPYHLSL